MSLIWIIKEEMGSGWDTILNCVFIKQRRKRGRGERKKEGGGDRQTEKKEKQFQKAEKCDRLRLILALT